MTEKYLHIVCLDVPYPVNYGGLFDLFYKLEALKQSGIRIYLHCFEYGRGHQPALNNYCEAVYYYPRRTGLAGISGRLPYIVNSRRNEALLQRLLQDQHPILLEGIHCTWPLLDERFKNRKLFVRLHNIEYEYYDQLSKTERSPIKKLYYVHESRLLRKYETRIADKAVFIAVSEKDAATYHKELGADTLFLPVFLPWKKPQSPEGMGQYCLYHGNLSVAENEHAAIWLLQEVFNELRLPFVIAGKDPSRKLQQLTESSEHTCLAANPSMEEMQDLIRKAHINILPAFNSTGVKLKLLNALFAGRHCIANKQGVEGSGLESCIHLAESSSQVKDMIRTLLHQEFTWPMIEQRASALARIYNNEKNSRQLIEWIW